MIDETICNVFPIDNNFYLWLTFKNQNGQLYYVVSDKLRREYYLFKGKKQLAKKSKNPCDLYKFMK